MTTTTEKNQPIEFRLRYPKQPKTEEVSAFSEVIEKIVVNEDVLAEEREAIELELVKEKGEGEGLDDVELEEEREKERKLEESRPEKTEGQTCL